MKKVFLFLATGFEEVEAVIAANLLLRGGVEIVTISITGNNLVKGSHGISVKADKLFEEINFDEGIMLVLPGGLVGMNNLNAHENLKKHILEYVENGKYVAAICSAPLIFGGLGILKGKKATCYPSLRFDSRLKGAILSDDSVVQDGKIITGKGPGFTFDFGLKIIAELQGQTKSDEVAQDLLLI
ncbi:MAG: DJ-1/PfpI family protein [Dysgonamonadaceae bacterium]|jgi:4-methyl-5(b-hydroxyethyl)-thiazole monophosphate biosynthesis|nr:DJ-1/PfpI family protein [Dysgonamonadaceae bacterium]